MSAIEWSDEQKDAIDHRGGSLLLSAAAGAGKTAVLVERVITRLTDAVEPVDVDRVLIVTFTNAAAAEMRERIGRELSRQVEKGEDVRHLRRQLTLLNHAAIGTLHSFCLEVVRQYFYRLDLNPDFRIADEGEAELLQLAVLEELLEVRYQDEDNQDFLALVDCYGGERNDADLIDIVLKVYRFSCSHPWPELWLAQAAASMTAAEGKLDNYPWARGLKQSLALDLKAACLSLRQAVELCSCPGGPAPYLENLRPELEMVEGLGQACEGPWQNLYASFQAVSFPRLKAVRKSDMVDPELQEQVKALRNQAKKVVNQIKEDYFDQSPERYWQDLQQMAPIIRALIHLVQDFGENFIRAKKRRAIVDFNDLEHYCLKLLLDEEAEPGELVPSSIARELQEHFVEVMVDEYQDINAVQEAILQLVSRGSRGEPNVFMVGDVKQSIYRFRLADPNLFMEKYRRFGVEKGQPERRINLKENFRSSASVVDGVNFIFRQIMTPYVGEMSYNQEAELVCGRKEPGGEHPKQLLASDVEVYIIDRGKESSQPYELGEQENGEVEPGEVDEDQGLLENAELEARLVASLIQDLHEGGRCLWDQKQNRYRSIEYTDIAVLMRTTSGVANLFMDELQRAGIPTYAELGSGYFGSSEIETIMSLLQVIDNPRQDIPLAAVLRSSLVGLSAGELAAIRCIESENEFHQAVIAAAAPPEERAVETKSMGLKEETRVKLAVFLENLVRWRTLARQERMTTLLARIYEETGYYDYVGGLPGGVQRQANLRLLQAWAGKYEATVFRGLFYFLRFIERLRESGRDMGSARTLSENEDVVRIMSIHKSKGLEFPVVFVAGMGRQFNLMDLRQTILMHKELYIGPQFVDPDLAVTYPTLAKLALRRKIRLETLAEEMRLLYVAMTRAREKLYLVGTVRNLESEARKWYWLANSAEESESLPENGLAGAAHYLDWIGPALCRHPASGLLWNAADIDDGPGKLIDEGQFQLHILGETEAGGLIPVIDQPVDWLQSVSQGSLLETGPHAGEVERRLSWQYPYQKTVGKAAKATVTEVKRIFDELQEEAGGFTREIVFTTQPRFMQDSRGLTPAERGIAMHTVLQHLDLQGSLNQEAIKEQVAQLVVKELLTREEAAVIDVPAIVRLFEGELGQRLVQAREVLREVPFSMAIPVHVIHPELPKDSGENIVVQGVIDCLADEGDGFLLVDYKTDWLGGPGRLEKLTDFYRSQLLLYARAVETILKQPVKEKYLYFLSQGVTWKID
ncbi:MAG: helicase-exonuclease AddAB subunit AddA [Syntrophomonadaceae bacterium]|jgi:ATP-dependent helicase/nuclease subunit A|nr:helicase-exonuclease AddAB subunit AddA [Syntrophomonadaceae bacterium]